MPIPFDAFRAKQVQNRIEHQTQKQSKTFVERVRDWMPPTFAQRVGRRGLTSFADHVHIPLQPPLNEPIRQSTPEGFFVRSFDLIDNASTSPIGGKAANLVLLRRAGLPVPAGYCIPTDAHEFYLENGKLSDGLITEIARVKSALGGKIALRSSANCEDGTELSMAGVFQSHYVYDDAKISHAVEHIFQQSRSKEVEQFLALHGKSAQDVKMGLIVQELIEPETAGVIYTGIHGNDLLIQYIDGFGATLVDGQTQGSSILVNKDNIILHSTGFEMRPLSSNTITQLADYSRTIEHLFPDIPQDIEFAYRDGTVHILQTRTLTADLGKVDLKEKETPQDTLEATKYKLRQLVAKEREEMGTPTAIFSDGNYSELLPKPKEMDIGLYMYVWGGSDGIPGATQLGRWEMGYKEEKEAIGVIHYIGGRAYFSLGRYAAMYHIGFPETKEEYFSTLVPEYLDAVQKDPQKGSYPQMGLFLQDPTREDLRARFGDRAETYYQTYLTHAERMRGFADQFLSQFYRERLPETTDFMREMQSIDVKSMTNEQLLHHGIGVLEHIRTSSYVDFVKAARLGLYYSQRLQDVLQQKLGIEKDTSQKMYSKLNQGLDGSAITDANIAIAEALSEEEAMQIAQQLVGHFSTGEMLEIRHQPLRDVPDALQNYVQGIRQTGQYKEQFQRQREARLQAQQALLAGLPEQERPELANVLQSSQTYMALRETTKYLFTKEYLLLRDTLEVLERRLGLETGDIYYIYPRELPHLVAQPQSMLHLIRSRKQAFKNYEELDMPAVIRESDIENLSLKKENNANFTEATGKFLAEGPHVEGVVVNIDEFDNGEAVSQEMKKYQEQEIPIILVATQMNLSHDPFIAQASGLVIENAGIVAHGAQRARELGKGAIGGVKSKLLKNGMSVSFDPGTRSIRKIEQDDEM